MKLVYLTILIYVNLLQKDAGVCGQKIDIQFDRAQSITQCSKGVEPYDKLVFNVFLDAQNVTKTDWPINHILLSLFIFPSPSNPGTSGGYGFDLCQVNIEQYGCNGFQDNQCGYCQDDEPYHVVFNITVEPNNYTYYDAKYTVTWKGRAASVKDEINIFTNGNTTFKQVFDKKNYIYLFSRKDSVFRRSPIDYRAHACEAMNPISWHLPLNYSIGDQFHQSSSSTSCFQLDDGAIRQNLDEKIVFRYEDQCKRLYESQCFGRDVLADAIFCAEPVFSDIPLSGKTLVRWMCLSIEFSNGIYCEIGKENNLNGTIFNSSSSTQVALIKQPLPIYQRVCEVEVHSNDIYNSSVDERLYWFIEAWYYLLEGRDLCGGLSDSFSHYVPTPNVTSDCPAGRWVKDGYIRNGTNATCLCEIASPDYSLGKVQWFDSAGVELSPEGITAQVDIVNDIHGNNRNYTCLGLSESGQYNVSIEFIPQYTYGPVVSNFTVNNTSSFVAQPGGDLTFLCEVESIFPAIAVLVGPGRGQIQEFRSQNQTLEFHLNNVTCEDSGRYECRGDDGVEFKAKEADKHVDVNIHCSIKLNNKTAERDLLEFTVKPQANVVITLEVYGYPEPTEYGLKVQQDNGASDVSKDKYTVTYTKLKPPFGLVTIEIVDSNTKISTTYVLNIKNGIGDGVDISFVVNKEPETITEPEEFSIPWLWIGVGIGCFIVVIIILVVVICFVKQERARAKAEKQWKEREDYSNLEFTFRDSDECLNKGHLANANPPKAVAPLTCNGNKPRAAHKNRKHRQHGPLPDIPGKKRPTVHDLDYVDPAQQGNVKGYINPSGPDNEKHSEVDYVEPRDPAYAESIEDDDSDTADYIVPMEPSVDYDNVSRK